MQIADFKFILCAIKFKTNPSRFVFSYCALLTEGFVVIANQIFGFALNGLLLRSFSCEPQNFKISIAT